MALNRRRFVAGLLASPLAAAYQNAAETAPPMRIRRIETVYWKSREDAPFWPHWTWLKIETESGVSGIGETYPRNSNEAAAIHGVAGQLIGHDARDIERIWADLYRSFDYQITGGAEMRVADGLHLRNLADAVGDTGGFHLAGHGQCDDQKAAVEHAADQIAEEDPGPVGDDDGRRGLPGDPCHRQQRRYWES